MICGHVKFPAMYIVRIGPMTIETESADEVFTLAKRFGINTDSMSSVPSTEIASAPSTKGSNGKSSSSTAKVSLEKFAAALSENSQQMIRFLVESGGSATTKDIAEKIGMDDARGVGALLRNVKNVGQRFGIEAPVRAMKASGAKSATIELSPVFASRPEGRPSNSP